MAQISVIVPVYKVEAYLNRCVDSILAQTFSDFELILVDDGSPDSCGQICEDYAARDNRIHVIHQRNGGLSAARNTGIDWVMHSSDSQWLAFVDSDDWVHEEYLQRLYQAVQTCGTRLSACGILRTAGDPLPEACQEQPKCLDAENYYCTETVHDGMTAVAWNKLYHRSLLETRRYPVGKLHEDEFTTYHIVYAAQQVAVVEAVLYAYYQNNAGIMLSKWNPRRMHILEAVEQQIAFAKETGKERFLNKAVLQYIFCIHEQLIHSPGEYHKALRKKLRKALHMGNHCGVFLKNQDNLWAYEEAYPVKPLWWLYFKIRAALKQ